MMDVSFAATLTLRLVNKTYEGGHRHLHQKSDRSLDGKGINHAVWMLEEVKHCRVKAEKAHRWLGWAQAILVYEGAATLEQCKTINALS